jgi:hypothetical protein
MARILVQIKREKQPQMQPRPKRLLEQVREAFQLKHYSIRTVTPKRFEM